MRPLKFILFESACQPNVMNDFQMVNSDSFAKPKKRNEKDKRKEKIQISKLFVHRCRFLNYEN